MGDAVDVVNAIVAEDDMGADHWSNESDGCGSQKIKLQNTCCIGENGIIFGRPQKMPSKRAEVFFYFSVDIFVSKSIRIRKTKKS